ncbi:MAG: hypothetical protein LBL30_00765 [Holosporales bacterium]|nr:hypothetical protein [Holosporales bacterium]
MSYKLFALLALCLLGGCVIAPLHKNDAFENYAAPRASAKGYPIKISIIPDRDGINLRNRLLEAFQDTPIYFPFPCKLETKLTIQTRELVKYPDGSTGRNEMTCIAEYSIVSIETGKELLKDKASATITCNIASQEGQFEIMIYSPYYNSMFEQIARNIYESVKLYVRRCRGSDPLKVSSLRPQSRKAH